MVKYKEYKRQLNEFEKLKIEFEKLLTKKQKLFEKTQPKGIIISGDKIESSRYKNILEEYVEQEEVIDKQLTNIKKQISNRRYLLKLALQEMQESKEIKDIIYNLYYIENLSCREIAEKVNYSKSQVHRILKKM